MSNIYKGGNQNIYGEYPRNKQGRVYRAYK